MVGGCSSVGPLVRLIIVPLLVTAGACLIIIFTILGIISGIWPKLLSTLPWRALVLPLLAVTVLCFVALPLGGLAVISGKLTQTDPTTGSDDPSYCRSL